MGDYHMGIVELLKQENPDVRRSREIAINLHANQYYANQPFSIHLDEVYKVTVDFSLDIPLRVAAFLHDSLEDTNTSRNYIREKFGPVVDLLVWSVTGVGDNRQQRNADIYQKLQDFPTAKDLKVADRIANLESSKNRNLPRFLKMYRSEHEEFSRAVIGANPLMLIRLETAIA